MFIQLDKLLDKIGETADTTLGHPSAANATVSPLCLLTWKPLESSTRALAAALLSISTAAVTMAQSHNAGKRTPYDLKQFRSVLDDSKPISLKNLATKHVDLEPRPDGFFNAEVRVQKGRMIITINGQWKVDMDVAYWDGLENYFKAGVHNQAPDRSKVEFESLRFSEKSNGVGDSH